MGGTNNDSIASVAGKRLSFNVYRRRITSGVGNKRKTDLK
jgi:hypothetical protein